MGFELTKLVVIYTDCIGSYKSNYHTITITEVPCIYETTNTEIGVMNITEYICLPFGRAPMPFNQYSLQVDLYIIGPYVATKTKRGPP
jgi:hypothetical protein